jgi:putative colanic acid biosysnthesis UDP-glucose lipid carrier transferase
MNTTTFSKEIPSSVGAATAPEGPLFGRRLVRANQPLTHWLQWLANGAVVTALLYAFAVERSGAFGEQYRVLAAVTLLVMVIIYHTQGVYRRYDNQRSGTVRVARVWLLTCAVLMLLGFATKTSDHFSRPVIMLWFTSSLVAQCAVYLAFHRFSQIWQTNLRVKLPAVVVGAGWLAGRLAGSVNRNVFLGDRIIGVVDRPELLSGWKHDEVPALGTLENIDQVLETHGVERVYIALPLERAREVAPLYRKLRRNNVDLIWVPDIFSLDLLNPGVREVAGIPLITLSESPLTSAGGAYVKSLIDVIGATSALILLGPLVLAVALTIRLTSPGPAIYRQTRVGWDGATFQIWKFRTMYVHDEGPNRLTQARKDDERVTPVGAILRRTSIDELPQLFNVLGGTMSLVGPRPHSIVHDNQYSRLIDAYMSRHRIKPGMTGWAQVNGLRGETRTVEAMRQRVEHDLEYINRWSIWFDLWILCRTPFAICSQQAY